MEVFCLGSHEWTVFNDPCGGDKVTTILSFTHCKEDQFTCNDGLCVDITDR